MRPGLGRNTLVVFLGDNGYLLGQHGRVEKNCFYEPAVRVPLILRWPGHLPEDRRIADMVELVDLFPTICHLLRRAEAADPARDGPRSADRAKDRAPGDGLSSSANTTRTKRR